MAKARKSKSSKVAEKVEAIKKSPPKKEVKPKGQTDEQVIEEISNSFTNNAAVYQAVLSQAVNKVGNDDLREVRAEIVKMDAVSQDNYESILSEIDKYKIVSE
tara:strand:+ start:67 stop:375 length:309 start_codon:yes stop_codon:yes gene_type:complete